MTNDWSLAIIKDSSGAYAGHAFKHKRNGQAIIKSASGRVYGFVDKGPRICEAKSIEDCAAFLEALARSGVKILPKRVG